MRCATRDGCRTRSTSAGVRRSVQRPVAARAVGHKGPDLLDETNRPAHSARLATRRYLALAFSHRFCLVAAGDTPSTHKVSETVALGGVGGCIPVIVVPLALGRHAQPVPLTTRLRQMLPYTRWLDWCNVAYLVEQEDASSRFAAVLRRLATVSRAEAAAKARALRRVHAAFTLRANSTFERPSAAEYVLAEACDAALRFRRAGGSGSPWWSRQPAPVAGGDRLDRCVVRPLG